MPGQAIVTIRDKQWAVSIASLPWELSQGLGGIPEMPAGAGMLFDTGWEQVIQVTTVPMLFPLDIAFLSESLVVTEVYRNVEPGYLVTSTLPTRYFLEVNAGELNGFEAGDKASVEFLPLEEIPVIIPDWVTTMTSFLGFVVMAIFMTVIVRDFVKSALEPPKKRPVLYRARGERLLPQMVGHKELAARIFRGLSGKGERYRAYAKYPKDKSAFVTVGAIVGGHYSWNPTGFTVWVDAWERNPEWPPDHILGIRELRRPRSFEATEEGVTKALEYVESEFPTFTESTWVSKSIPAYVAQELGILKLEHLPQTARKLTSIWFEKGVQAGRTDGWMDVENTIKETAQKHPEMKDVHELVWTDIDLWEETDHFNILYSSKMWEDAKGDVDVYSHLKSEFWEGYLAGRKEIGKDIYRIAGELVKSPPTEVVPLARYRGLAVMPRLPEEAKKDILFVEHIRDLVKLGERVTDAEARLMWEAWKKRYPQHQAQTIPRDNYELGYKHGMSICGLYGVKQARKLARLKPINSYERGKKQACIDYLKQRGIEVPVEARRRKSPTVVPAEPRRPRPGQEGQLEFLPDSPEVLAQTIDAIGYREKIDSAFQEAIRRVKGLSDIYRGFKEFG